MPFKGFCLSCNTDISADTQDEFGEKLSEHHDNLGRGYGSYFDGCNVFQVTEVDSEGNPIGQPFGLDATREGITHSWTGVIWDGRGHGGSERM